MPKERLPSRVKFVTALAWHSALQLLPFYQANVCKLLKETHFPLVLCPRERRRNGFDRFGFSREGFNDAGFDRFGFDKDGYDKSGFGEWFGR